jgi:hypothetical protein
MPSDQLLLRLADRCEQGECDWPLDDAIAQAALGLPPCGTAGPRSYTTSLDATVTLVPSDMEWAMQVRPGDAIMASVWPTEDDDGIHAYGATPALALCAAALRARAVIAA